MHWRTLPLNNFELADKTVKIVSIYTAAWIVITQVNCCIAVHYTRKDTGDV